MNKSIKFLTFNDVHISDTTPGSRTGNYRDDILDKLSQIKLVGKKTGVDFFLNGGDLFHFKQPMRNSHQLVNMLTRLFKTFPAPIYSTEGNHDLRYDSYDTFDQQPLSVLYENEVLTQARYIFRDINGVKVRIRSFPFSEEPDLGALSKELDPKGEEADIKICMLHLYSTPKGGTLFKHKLFSYDEIATLGDDIFLLGHYHIDQGIQKIGNQHFINVGALSRGSLSEDNIKRKPKTAYVTVSKEDDKVVIKVVEVNLRVKPVEEIFNLEEKEEEKKKIKQAEAFVNELQSDIKNSGSSKNDVNQVVENLNIDKSILDRVRQYLVSAEDIIKELK